MRAFGLTADTREAGFAGGSIAVPPNGETIDLAERLDDEGTLVTDNHVEADLLAAHPGLEELTGAEYDAAVTRYQAALEAGDVSKRELQERARALGLSASGNKDEIAARIVEHEAAGVGVDD